MSEDPEEPSLKKVKIKQSPYQWWEKTLNSPKYITAPMVDLSELAFRMQTRSYGADLCYTPMLHAKNFSTSASYRRLNFFTHENDSPLIAQIAGDDPKSVVETAKFIQNDCVAVDLNLGCPQGIAKKGNYGSYLLDYPEIITSVTSALVSNLDIPVTCKIRLLSRSDLSERLQETSNLISQLESTGISALTIHCRTKENKGHDTGPADWVMFKQLKDRFRGSFPMILNGGIETYQDIQRAFEETGCDAVMSSEAILENPALFSNKFVPQEDLAVEYLRFAEKYRHACPKIEVRCVKTHMFRILHGSLQRETDLRDQLAAARSVKEIHGIVDSMIDRKNIAEKEGKSFESKGWYRRHRDKQIVT
jgi:tRNA-dihydrouridine synthase